MPLKSKLCSTELSLLLTVSMLLMTACSGTAEPGTDSGSGGEVSTDSTGDVPVGTDGDGTDGDGTDGDGTDVDGTDGDGTDVDGTDGEVEETPDPIGNPIGESIQITHAQVKLAVDSNISAHLNGLEAALVFVEASNALTNLVEIFLDEEDEGEHSEEGDENDPQEDEPVIDVDFSEFRDDLLETISDRILVESTSVLSADGTQLTYTFTPEYFCASEETDEELSEEELAERAEDEADCAERITNTPIYLAATSDAENDINLVLLVGTDELEVARLQVHDDIAAMVANLPGVKALLEVFIDAEDFEFPNTMDGVVAAEVRNVGTLQYDLRFAINEAVQLVAAPDQETVVVDLEQNLEPGALSLDGVAGTITGGAELSEVLVGLPWQLVVDLFWDDEGSMETVCETDEVSGEMNCWDEYVEAPESPDVEGMMHIQIAGVSGSIDVSSVEDVFDFTNLSLGNAPIMIDVAGETILTFNLNPNQNGILNVKMVGETPLSTRWEMSPALDATVAFTMDDVKDGFQDLPEFMLNETLGVRMEEAEGVAGSMSIMRDEEDSVNVQVVAGQLTLWSDAMESDVVITAGQCIESIDEDTLTEEEQDAQHGLFGGLYGASCSE